jgi:hypothetical protein
VTGCGAPTTGVGLDAVDLARTAVVQGVVSRDGAPVAGAYVRLLDPAGEFTAEVPTSVDGAFRFFAADGQWTVRILAPGSPAVDRTVRAAVGGVADLEVVLA